MILIASLAVKSTPDASRQRTAYSAAVRFLWLSEDGQEERRLALRQQRAMLSVSRKMQRQWCFVSGLQLNVVGRERCFGVLRVINHTRSSASHRESLLAASATFAPRACLGAAVHL